MTGRDHQDDPDLRIIGEERLPIEEVRARHEIHQSSQDRSVQRQHERLKFWGAFLVVAAGLPYLAYVALYGTENQQARATHLLAVAFGIAVGALNRSG